MTAPSAVKQLIQRFKEQEGSYLSSPYKEAEVRREFIEPLFETLGWDVWNRSGYAEAYKDVVAEYSLTVGSRTTAPDYSFRIGGIRRFFVEAKRPALDVGTDPESAFQVRRYGWSAKLGVSVLTNFRQLAIYDCRITPDPSDGAEVARLKFYELDRLDDAWDEIASLLSKEAILKGSLDDFTTKAKTARGERQVDETFLKQLEDWRIELAADIALRNVALDSHELDMASQLILDRIVFLRICEDRGIEPYGQLGRLRDDQPAYQQLMHLFRLADAKYNSGLFHFDEESGRSGAPDTLTPRLDVADDVLRSMVRQLYFPVSPFAFAVIPPEILGHVYEEFLGSHIVLQDDRVVSVTTKPDVKKAGGVVYTPTDIVSFINEAILGPITDNAHASDIAGRRQPRKGDPIRIVDPACGSGSFLLDAYEQMLNWYLQWYVENDPVRRTRGKSPELRLDQSGSYQLTIAERRRILTDHIFGVDIDEAAVEVTKLSLLLKVLERESEETLGQSRLALERALPDLGPNIAVGNSLIGTDFYRRIRLPGQELARRVNPFDWRSAFSDVFAHGGFDAVIGNPPWLMAGYYLPEEALEYLRQRYVSATGKFDLYYVFLELSNSILRPGGRLGMIVPNKLFHTRAARALRGQLAEGGRLETVVDFGIEKVFEKTTNYSAILIMGEESTNQEVTYERRNSKAKLINAFPVNLDVLSEGPWTFLREADISLFSKMESTAVKLEDVAIRFATGVQSGADSILVLKADSDLAKQIEPGLLRRFLKGRNVRRWRCDDTENLLLFPYVEKNGEFRLLTQSELASYPATLDYLNENRQRLMDRRWFGKSAEELSGAWYGLMYVEDLESFVSPHLLTPALAKASEWTIGSGSLFATGTAGVVGAVFPSDTSLDELQYLAGLLNSSLLSHFFVTQSPSYQGDYHKFSRPYIADAPIVPFDEAQLRGLGEDIAATSASLAEIRNDLDTSDSSRDRRLLADQYKEVSLGLDDLVCGLYGLSRSDVAHVPHRESVIA